MLVTEKKLSALSLFLLLMFNLSASSYAQNQSAQQAQTEVEAECNAALKETRFDGLFSLNIDKEKKIENDAKAYADKLVKAILKSAMQSQSNLSLMGDLNQQLINDLSMDPSSLGSAYEDRALANLNKLEEVTELTGSLNEQLLQFKKMVQKLLPEIRTNATKTGDAIEEVSTWVPDFLGGKIITKKIQEKRDAKVTIKTTLATVRAAIDAYAKKVDTYSDLIPSVITDIGQKNFKARVIKTALSQVMEEYKAFLAKSENDSSVDHDTKQQYMGILTGLSNLLTMVEKIIANNSSTIVKLSTAHNQIMGAAQDMNLHGRSALKEIEIDLATLDVTNLAEKINQMNIQLIKLSELSSESVRKSLEAGKVSQINLAAQVKSAADKLKINNKAIIQLSIDALNGKTKQLAYNDDLIRIFQEIASESDQAAKILSQERAAMGVLSVTP